MSSPFLPHPDALAAHKRQPAGRVVIHLTDDPESREEFRAEQARMKALRYQQRRTQLAKEARLGT